MIIFYELLSHFDWFITYNPLEDRHIDYVSLKKKNVFFFYRVKHIVDSMLPFVCLTESQKSSKCDKNVSDKLT